MVLNLSIQLAFLLLGAYGSAQDYLFSNAKLIDPSTQKVSDASLVIKDGTIEQILPKPPPKFSGKTIDLSGKFIMPALSDTHVHAARKGNWGLYGVMQESSIQEVGKLLLWAGVTSYLDLFADERNIFKWRTEQRKSHVGADVYAAGPMITCTDGHGAHFEFLTRIVNNPKDAAREIAALAEKKPDYLKIAYDHAGKDPVMTRATMEAAMAAGKKHGLKAVVHIGTWKDAKEAVLAGAVAITHLYTEDIPDDLVKLMHDKGVVEIPTMSYQTELLNLKENIGILHSPMIVGLVAPTVLESYRAPEQSYYISHLVEQNKARPSYFRSLKKLHDGGVTVLVGTDSGGSPAVFFGIAAHREMRLLTLGSFSNWEALAAGTTLAHKFLGRKSGIGIGERADFVVLTASPIEDISNTQEIESVFHHGNLIDVRKFWYAAEKTQ